jgi:two-component system chemotaxis sensor kinase CheA
MDRFRETFRDEAGEILAELEAALLELELSPRDGEAVSRVFRALHTIKGSGALSGFDHVAAFTHEVETVFELVRDGRLPVNKELIDLTLGARDRIKMLIESDGGIDDERTRQMVTAFRRYLPADEPSTGEAAGGNPDSLSPSEKITYRILFRPPADIFLRGINPLALLKELAQLGECRITTHTDAVPALETLDPELCHLWWDIVLVTSQGANAIRDVFIFVEDECELRIEAVEENEQPGNNGRRSGPETVKPATPADRERPSIDSVNSVRVRSEKLDSLVDLIGELVTVQARLSQAASKRDDPDLDAISEEVERLTWGLRDQVLGIRMLPIGTTFRRFGRLVRDLSDELGKDVELTTEGAETELDKTVIERLGDPLVHLIRNGIDHGIEAPVVREAAGKPTKGRIHLAASHVGGNVLLKISDDGAGLDHARIHAKAVAMGLAAADAELNEKDLSGLIFHSGLSTAASVSSVSGRGVGMDVVRKAVEGLRGGIEISSSRGEGTTFTIKLPLTLAIIDGLMVRIGGEIFILPLSVVEECIELKREDAARSHGRNLVHVRGETVPYLRLRERFSIGGEPPDIEQVVIAEADGQRVGFAVDHVIGEHQTVLKALGGMYRDVKGISGATILGDGGVALILDLSQLVREAEIADRLQLEVIAKRHSLN